MSMQRVEDNPVVTQSESLTLVRDDDPSSPSFAQLRRAPKPVPSFGDRSQDQVPRALPTSWGPPGATASA